MEPQTITEFLTDRISELDSSLVTYLADLAKVAALGTDYLSGMQTNMDYIENALMRKGLYEDLLAGIKAGYIVLTTPAMTKS